MKRSQPTSLWEIRYTTRWDRYDIGLWVLADSAEVATLKSRKFLKKKGNTLIKINSVVSKGTIDIF